MSKLEVGVVMPTFNQAKFIREAVASVIDQPWSTFIVVDDASTDETPAILDELDVDHIRHAVNKRCPGAINTGVSLMPGMDAYTWVSSDNVMHPRWLEVLKERLAPGVGAVYSSFRIWHGNSKILYRAPYSPSKLTSSPDCYFGPSFLIRREVWGEHRGGSAHDYDHWARVEEACWARGLSIEFVDEPLCDYRVHPDQFVKKRPELFDAPMWQAEAIARRAR